MNLRAAPIACCLVLATGQAGAGPSSWDEVQLRLLQQHSTPLRWDNVEGAPYRVSGPKPHARFGQRLHLIQLQPGETVTLRAPESRWLRLVGEARTLSADDFEIGISADARMFAAASPLATSDPHSLLVELPPDKPSLVRLNRSLQAESNLVFAACFSREEPFNTFAPHREAVRLPGKSVRLRREGEILSHAARELDPGEELELSLKGPARLELVVTLRWPRNEPRREQSLVLQLALDGAAPVPLWLSPGLDARHRTRVNHATELVSHRMNAFVDVPAGNHRLCLQASAPVYLSLFRQSHSDFLLPWLNGPGTNTMALAHAPWAPVPEISADAIKSLSPTLDARDLAVLEQQAWQLARDNEPLEAGAQADDWLNRVAQSRPDYPAARRTAVAIQRQRTAYQEILPVRMPEVGPLPTFLFAATRLRPLFEPEQHVAVCNPTLEQVDGMFARGHFATVPPAGARGLLYELPERAYDSELRIAALTSAATGSQFLVQFDDEAPFQVVLDAATVLPAEELAASDALATLRVVEQEAHLPANVVLGHPVGAFDLPAPVAEAGVVEVALPQRVRQVRIHLHEATDPVQVSVAYRAAKRFALGETAYLALVNQVGSHEAMRMLAQPEDASATARPPALELRNHLLPLTRLLRSHSNDFSRSIDPAFLPARTGAPLDAPNAALLRESALQFERDGQLMEALEIWNRLVWEGAAPDQSQAVLALMRGLASHGEEFLAAQYARYALLTSPGTQLSGAAVAVLEAAARQDDDTEVMEQWRAFLFLRCPCAQHLAGLAEALTLNGQDEWALATGALLPRERQPVELLLGAALHENWWQTFDQLVAGLSEHEAQWFWRAQQHLAFHRFVEAEQALTQSGEQGREMLQALQAGLRIREQLGAPGLSDRLKAVLAWEQWQLAQPGPKSWQAAGDVLQESSATAMLFNCEANRFSTWLRTDPGQPVKLRFPGPLRLQVEARPILSAPFQEPVDDWLAVSEYGITNRFPISQSVPNPNLQFTSEGQGLAGVKTVATLEYGAGWHEVEVALASHSGLIHVLQEQPALPTRILPMLTAERINRVLWSGGEPRPIDAPRRIERESDVWWVPSELAHSRPPFAPVSAHQDSNVAQHAAVDSAGLTGIEQLQLALRMACEPGAALEYDSRLWQALPLSEQWLAACRGRRWSEFTQWAALPAAVQVRSQLAVGRIQEVLDAEAPRDVLQRLITLLEISELHPAWREQAQLRAETLVAETNCPPEGKPILMRLTRDRIWEPLKITPLSAGIRPILVPSDLPQDPSTRLRRALLPPVGTNQFTLSGQSVFTASLTLHDPARLRLGAELVRAGFSPLIPLTVSLQVDNLEVRAFALGPSRPDAETRFLLSEGPHLIRVWIEDPVVNQFVRLSLSGRSDGPANALWSQSLAEAASERRFFHAATHEQPVRFSWKGPALLRVDEYREGRFFNQLRPIDGGEQTVEIPAAPGCAESWYQVFVRNTQTNRPRPRIASTLREPEVVPPPKLRLPESPAPSQAQLVDYYRLGGQEDGTWTPGLLLAQRRPFDLSTSQSSVQNEFIEANVAYRKAAPGETLWFRTEALGRWHRPGDLTFGLTERVEGHPQTLPFDWSWMGEAYVGSTGPQQQDVQWALHTGLELRRRIPLNHKLDCLPFGGLFARHLSLDPETARDYDYIDQDLYTSFQDEHRWGWVLGDQLEYSPWLDTRIKGGGYLVSNENFTPDNWGLQLSWTQLMGPFCGEVGYRFRYFLSDADRSSESWLHGVSAGLLVERWIRGQQRIELGVQFRHDWPDAGESYFVVFKCDLSQGRRYRDHGPHETVFRELRNRRFPAAFNNLFQPGPPGATVP